MKALSSLRGVRAAPRTICAGSRHADAAGLLNAAMWQKVSSAPFDQDLELAVINHDGPHALVFPCRRVLGGWVNAETKERLDVRPTHWRSWGQAS